MRHHRLNAVQPFSRQPAAFLSFDSDNKQNVIGVFGQILQRCCFCEGIYTIIYGIAMAQNQQTFFLRSSLLNGILLVFSAVAKTKCSNPERFFYQKHTPDLVSRFWGAFKLTESLTQV